MVYYVGYMPYSSDLYHHGIKGQKWGIRRFQNPDGSLTQAGVKRYGTVENFNKAQEQKSQAVALRKQKRAEVIKNISNKGRQAVEKFNSPEEKAKRAEKIETMRSNSVKRGQKLSIAGYKKRYNIANAIGSSIGNQLATNVLSSVAYYSGHRAVGNIIKAVGTVNTVAIWGQTAKNMFDYENYRNRSKLSFGVR